jgi:hypothetical protein
MAENWWETESVVETEETPSSNWWEQETVVDSAENQTQAALSEAETPETNMGIPYDAAMLKSERERGVSDTALVDQLINQGASVLSVNDQPFNVAAARKDGVRDDEIMQILITGKPYMKSAGRFDAFGQGINMGLANVIGAPVDLVNWSAGQLERGGRAIYNQFADEPVSTDLEDTFLYSDYPLLGSDSIRDGMGAVTQGLGGSDIPDTTSELAPEYRPYAQAGRVVGESSVMLTPFALARAGVGMSHPIVARAATNPKSLLIEEGISTAGAAQFAGIAQVFAPDNEWAQMGAEFVGSIANPIGLAYRGGKGATNFGGKQLSRLKNTIFRGKAGAQDAAIAELLKVASESGMSADDLLESIYRGMEANASDVPLTAGQLTGNPVLLGFENNLAKQSAEFRGVRDASIEDAFANLRNLSETMLRSGDESTRLAGAEMQKAYFNNLLNAHVANARDAATVAANKFDAQDTAGASKAAYQAIYSAKEQARAVETALWDQVNRSETLTGEGILSSIDGLSGRILDGEPLGTAASDPIIRQFADKIRTNGNVSSGDVLRFRSRMLEFGRDAAAQGKFGAANMFEQLANGALDDMAQMTGESANIARTFSRNLNERFNAGFPRQALARGRTGEVAINPELTLERGFAGGKATGDLQFRQMDEAVTFGDEAARAADAAGLETRVEPEYPTGIEDANTINVPNQNLSADVTAPIDNVEDLFNAQETFLRGRVDALRNPTTGAIEARRIDKFVTDNPDLVERFPNLKQDMLTAADAQRTADEVMETIGKAAENESLVTTVGQVLSSNTPSKSFEDLAKLAPDGDSVSGLRNAVVDWAMKDATDAKGKFDFIKFSQNIAQPLTDEGKTALDIMIDNGVMTAEQVQGIGAFVEQGLRVQVGSKSPEYIDEIIEQNSSVLNNLARMVGANVGAKANEITGSFMGNPSDSGLQSAAIFSAWAKKIVEAGPQARTRDAMIAMFKDPQLLADAISRNPEVSKRSSMTIKEILARSWNDFSLADTASKEVFERRTTPANTLVDTEDFNREEPLPSSIDVQMKGALPEVDLPTLNYDEDGNYILP